MINEANINSEEFRKQHDIGYYLNVTSSSIEDNLKVTLLTEHWTPPSDFIFPYSSQVSKGKTEKRYLRQSHLNMHSQWLVFSPKLNGLLCKWCVLMAFGEFGKLD